MTLSTKSPKNPSPNKKTYLFRWDEVPGNDSVRLLEFLKQKFGVSWVERSKIEKFDNARAIRVTAEKNYLSLELNNEKTFVNLKIDDVRRAEFIAKSENGKLNIYKKTKRSEFKDIWERPTFSKLDLKIWIPGFKSQHNKMIGIGLGTKVRLEQESGMFSFVAIDKDKIDWLINAINESILIRNQNKDSSLLNPIISKKHLILDYLRKISITILVKGTDNNLSIILMLNSKPSLYTVLSDSDIEWVISTLELAKYNLSDVNDDRKDSEYPRSQI